MTYYADLSPCACFVPDHEEKLLAVGWHDSAYEYARGDVAAAVVSRLCELLVSPWEAFVMMGHHACPFCRFSAGPGQFTFQGTTVNLGSSNLFVPGDGVVYAAPSLMLHYIDAHEYAPPTPFCEAVLACPEMSSREYFGLLRANGPKALFE